MGRTAWTTGTVPSTETTLTGCRPSRAATPTLWPTTTPPRFTRPAVSQTLIPARQGRIFSPPPPKKKQDGPAGHRRPQGAGFDPQGNSESLFCLAELKDMPVGTGSLFVTCNERPHRLVKENRCMNLTEREECLVVQYLSSGGHETFTGIRGQPARVFSGVHSGGGQLGFGCSVRQKSDLCLFFDRRGDSPAELHYHNYHGYNWHYRGHERDCPAETIYEPFEWDAKSKALDDFRATYAEALSSVNPDCVLFRYSVSTSCDYWHGRRLCGLADPSKTYQNLQELVAAPEEASCNFYLPPGGPHRQSWDKSALLREIRDGRVEGFVTLTGGEETASGEAGRRFGFCVQNYAPLPAELSEYTKTQMEASLNMDAEKVAEHVSKLSERTLNSGTFHGEETVSTSYLRWLMQARGFQNFEITHFVQYRFDDHSREFVEPILQKRHEVKQRGSVAHAEALKLIANSDYGYQGLEAYKYDDCRLMTGDSLRRNRSTKLLHLSLKHVTLIGIVKRKSKRKKPKASVQKKKKRARQCEFLADEADETDAGSTEADSDNDDDDDDDDYCRGLSESEPDTATDPELSSSEEDERTGDGGGDLNELAVQRAERSSAAAAAESDHTYASTASLKRAWLDKKDRGPRYVYDFLYCVTASGENKAVKNCLPKAVAILSNSKVIFLSHIDTMLRCLDPGKAEICYTDTDSCIFSLTHKDLEDNLAADRVDEWRAAGILADEQSPTSCHGKMKLEGVFKAGLFKALKIYRLFTDVNFEQEFAEQTCYTRCKGVNKNIAKRIPNAVFERDFLNQVVVHRSCLRPNRTGEMLIAHEAKSLAFPFNLKRFVTADGLHSFPVSYFADGNGGDALSGQI